MLRVLRHHRNFRSIENTLIKTRMSFNINNYSTESITDRYKAKLLAKAKAKGFNSIDELQDSMKETLEANRKAYDKIDPLKELEKYDEQVKMSQTVLKANELRKSTKSKPVTTTTTNKDEDAMIPNKSESPYKVLDSYIKLDKIKNLSTQEIEYLWRTKWGNVDGAMNAVVPVNIFDKILDNAKKNPIFVLPLPRKSADPKSDEEAEGIELHYIQWQFPDAHTTHCIMTPLAEFKLHQEFARPHTTFEFHSELASQNKIVLMNGLVEPNMNISSQDAQLLLLNVQRFYGAMGEETPTSKQRLKLLRDFTSGSLEFNVTSLIALAQSMEN